MQVGFEQGSVKLGRLAAEPRRALTRWRRRAGRNVVLKASRKTTRGFTAKVCDFGLATVSGGKDSESRPETFGTLSHMAPETLIEGRVCFKSGSPSPFQEGRLAACSESPRFHSGQ